MQIRTVPFHAGKRDLQDLGVREVTHVTGAISLAAVQPADAVLTLSASAAWSSHGVSCVGDEDSAVTFSATLFLFTALRSEFFHSRNSVRVQELCVALIHVSWPLRIISTNQFGGRAIGKLPRKSALLSSRDTRILRSHCIPPPAPFQVTKNATAVAQSHQISRMVFGSTPYCCASSVLCGPCPLAFPVGFSL